MRADCIPLVGVPTRRRNRAGFLDLKWRVACALKPRVVVRGVIDHQLDDHINLAFGVLASMKRVKPSSVPYAGSIACVVGDVIAVVQQRRRENGQEAEAGDAQPAQIIQFARLSRRSLTMPSSSPSEVPPHVQFVDDRVLIPLRIVSRMVGRRSRVRRKLGDHFGNLGRRRGRASWTGNSTSPVFKRRVWPVDAFVQAPRVQRCGYEAARVRVHYRLISRTTRIIIA